MRQAWHIFLKDARRLRYEILVVLALTAAYAWSQGHWSPLFDARTERLNQIAGILRGFLLPMAWWYLVSLAVYGEPLPGDRQFWVTRPYRWTSLLGAKLLFIAAFVNFPLILADCFILALQGFKPWTNPGSLLWHQIALSAAFLLPMIAIACITISFAQVVLVGLGIIVFLIVLVILLSPGGNTAVGIDLNGGWIDGSLICLILLSGAVAIMILQYRTRHTWISRTIFVAALLLVLCSGKLLHWDTAYGLQSRFAQSRVDTSSLTAGLSPESGRPATVPPEPQNPVPPNFARVGLPVRFDGVPTGTTVATDAMMAELSLPNGKRSKTLLSFTQTAPDTVWHYALVERGLFAQVKNTPTRLHITFYLTVLGDPHTEAMPLSGGPYHVPGVGLCQFDPRPDRAALSCRAAFRPPPYVLAHFDEFDKDTPGEQQQVDYSPFPAEFGISPISDNSWPVPKGATTLAFTTMKPLAHIRRELDIPSAQLLESAP
ncbi:MAG TPA: hypothetical protein VEN79_05235 [Terriglobia bacterium]|nr:hypothetical protein [Terriglobia bacterium]